MNQIKIKNLKQGDRIGMIRFGSRADVYYENYEPLVKIGQTAICWRNFISKKIKNGTSQKIILKLLLIKRSARVILPNMLTLDRSMYWSYFN